MSICANCGVELNAAARFCSTCGREAASTAPARRGRDWDFHVTLLAWLIIAQAALSAAAGLVIIVAGRIGVRFLLVVPDGPPPEVVQLIGLLSVVIGLACLAFSLPSIASGVGLLSYRNWGRILTLVLSFLKIFEFPFGTATSFYAFWVLLSAEGRESFRRRAALEA
jgi:hypothetical protein